MVRSRLLGRRHTAAVVAAADLADPKGMHSIEDYAAHVEHLYDAHHLMFSLVKDRWLKHVDQIAQIAWSDFTNDPDSEHAGAQLPQIAEALKEHDDAQWLVVDCLGIALLSMFQREARSMFSGWKIAQTTFALASDTTTTDEFYRGLVRSDVSHKFEKTNVVDQILHERFLPFPDLKRILAAELSSSVRSIVKRF